MTDEVEYPPLPEALTVPIYDNHPPLGPPPEGEGAKWQSTLDYKDALDRASSVGVRGVVQVGTDLASSIWSADIAAREPRVLAAVALHPNEAPVLDAAGTLDDALAAISELAGRPRVRAIGETGLDFFRTGEDGQDAQRRSFEAHIAIAKEHGLALQIHDRDAHRDVIETLLRVGAPERTVFHCFSGDAELASILSEHGWYASFAGTVTFKNAPNLRDALEALPRRLVLVETEPPFLPPLPFPRRAHTAYPP